MRMRRIIVVGALGGASALLLVPWVGFRLATAGAISGVRGAPVRKVALVLGAGLTPNGEPSDVLAARVKTAAELYRAGTTRKLVMSGDNSLASHDEVSAMKRLAVSLGVSSDDVLLDYAGFRTLDSCVRIRKVFKQNAVLVVSQRFHLARAIHLCRWAGVDAHGVAAPDPRSGRRAMLSTIREFPAATQAWFDVHVIGRRAKFLGPTIDVDHPPADVLTQPLK